MPSFLKLETAFSKNKHLSLDEQGFPGGSVVKNPPVRQETQV